MFIKGIIYIIGDEVRIIRYEENIYFWIIIFWEEKNKWIFWVLGFIVF